MILSYEVGDRSGATAHRDPIEFMDDLRSRLVNRVQLTTDGHKAYLEAVEGAFGADVDYAQLIKLYGDVPEARRRYSSGPQSASGRASAVSTATLTTRMSARHMLNART